MAFQSQTQIQNISISFCFYYDQLNHFCSLLHSCSNKSEILSYRSSIDAVMNIARKLAQYPLTDVPSTVYYLNTQNKLSSINGIRQIQQKYARQCSVTDLYCISAIFKELALITRYLPKPPQQSTDIQVTYDCERSQVFRLIHTILQSSAKIAPKEKTRQIQTTYAHVRLKSTVHNISNSYSTEAFTKDSSFNIKTTNNFIAEYGSTTITDYPRPLLFDPELFKFKYMTDYCDETHYSFCVTIENGYHILNVKFEKQTRFSSSHIKVLQWCDNGQTVHIIQNKVYKDTAADIIKLIRKNISIYEKCRFQEVSKKMLRQFQLGLCDLENKFVCENKYKFGLICLEQVFTKDTIWNPKKISPDCDEFMTLLGRKVDMNRWSHYGGGLDTSSVSKQQAIYSDFHGIEIIFHPNTYGLKEQIEEDLVVLVWMEDNSLFDLEMFRGAGNCVWMIVFPARNENRKVIGYKLVVIIRNDVEVFSPQIPRGCMFDDTDYFKEFLFTKMIMAEIATLRSPAFQEVKSKERRHLLNSFVKTYIDTKNNLE
ncbi:Rap-GAP domain-containing protein [Entamoeba marina]